MKIFQSRGEHSFLIAPPEGDQVAVRNNPSVGESTPLERTRDEFSPLGAPIFRLHDEPSSVDLEAVNEPGEHGRFPWPTISGAAM